MKEMVDLKMVHRDLKPENVFIHNGVFKIADFGFCGFLTKPD
jgi:serine/threonine protein kinase